MTTRKKNIDIEEKIDRYLNEELPQNEVDDLWAAMIENEAHMDYLQNSANLKELLHQPEQQKSNDRRVWMYAAAAVIVLMIVVLAVVQTGVLSPRAAVKPVETIELNHSRSADLPKSKKKKIIIKAIDLFNQNKIEEAVAYLNDQRAKAKDDDWFTELDIVIGTIYYDTNHFNKAAYYFTDVINYQGKIKKLRIEKAYWYLGNSYFQMGNFHEAHKAIVTVYHMNGAYSRVAKKYLDALADYRSKQKKS